MKALILAFATFMSTSAFAYTYTNWPKLGGVEVNQLCQGANSIQSLQPVKSCLRYETKKIGGRDGGVEHVCAAYSNDISHIPYSYEKTTCVDYKTVGIKDNKELVCTEWATKTVQTPVNFEVGVYRQALGKARAEEGDKLLYTFEYTIPACK